MTVLHSGATKKYSDNWGDIFAGKKSAAKGSGSSKKKATKKKKKSKVKK